MECSSLPPPVYASALCLSGDASALCLGVCADASELLPVYVCVRNCICGCFVTIAGVWKPRHCCLGVVDTSAMLPGWADASALWVGGGWVGG